MVNEPEKPIQRLFSFLGSYKKRLYFSVGSSAVHKIFDLMPPFIIGWTIDILSNNTPAWIANVTGSSEILANALFCVGLIVVIFLLESLTEWMLKFGFLTLAQQVQHDLRIKAYNHMQSREIAYFEENRTGNLMSMLNDDINQLERFLNDNLNQIVQLVTLFIFAGWAFSSITWQLTVAGMLPVPVIIWASVYYQKLIGPRYRHIRQMVGRLSSRLENNISGILVIKSFTAEKYESRRVEEVSEEYRKANYQAIRFSSLYTPIIRIFIAIGFAAGVAFSAWHIVEGTGLVTVGQLTLFAMMIQRFLWPITRLGVILDELERARASARRIFGLMDTPNLLQEPQVPTSLNGTAGAVSFEQTGFRYQQGPEVIKDLSLLVKPGQTIGIAGPTGGGKTTLIKLLLRLYDVNRGAVKIDGVDIRNLSTRELRSKIALVSQDVYLFHGSIGENIAYGMENATPEQIMDASKKAQLHGFVCGLPKGYDTVVGERGIKLSGGQRQRISIARAILKNAPILILDEATSAVDTETEQAIQQNLNRLVEGRTALIIAHRLSTIRNADQIVVLKDGQVAEKGLHEELLATRGIYADLWNVQTGVLENR